MLPSFEEDGKPGCPHEYKEQSKDGEFNRAQIAIIWYVAAVCFGISHAYLYASHALIHANLSALWVPRPLSYVYEFLKAK